ncbi:MAG: hypothetical protein HYR85_21820 [Planctomycetes bacterium]|nr:hypothetical protein [Planctomycetota bacterium]MBI3846175.1 hypothetical protein [Planctomycetota bacterium]
MIRAELRFVSRIVALAWACGWACFFMVFTLADCGSPRLVLLRGLFAALVFFGSVAVSHFRERLGAALLILEGVALAVGCPLFLESRFTLGTIAVLIATFAGPPFVSGIALVLARKAVEPRRPQRVRRTRLHSMETVK